MALFEIKNKFDGSVIFKLECGSLKLCVEAAVKSSADLSYADLSSADLSYANLSYADLSYADLSYANLRYANLSYADLSYADLSYANLRSANLRSADLSYANLRSADLSSADLRYADLCGAKYGEGVPIEHEPLQTLGTKYAILVMDDHIQIGCKLYSHDQWATFTDDEIAQMDTGALEWWNEWRGFVLSLSIGHQQRIAAKKAKPD